MTKQDMDHVDEILDQWRRERPDLDSSPMGLFGRISRVSRLLEKRIEEGFADYGLHGGLFDVLAALRRAGPPFCLTPTELYDSLLVSSGAMTNRLERLSGDGLIERIPDTKDGRSLLVSLTKKGRELIDNAVSNHLDIEHKVISFLSPSEREAFVSLLRKLVLELGDAPRGWPITGNSRSPKVAG